MLIPVNKTVIDQNFHNTLTDFVCKVKRSNILRAIPLTGCFDRAVKRLYWQGCMYVFVYKCVCMCFSVLHNHSVETFVNVEE